MTLELVLLAVLLGCSALFSGSETALFALTPTELRRFARDPRASRRMVADLLREPRKLLLTLMIGNVTINMFIFAVSLAMFQRLAAGGRWEPLAPVLGLISPVVVTLLGEILPKGMSIVMRVRIAVRIAPLIRVIHVVLTPLSLLFNVLLVDPLTRLLAGGPRVARTITTDELHELVQLSQRHRIIDEDENAMLSGVLQLHELKVRDVMIPRVDMTTFDVDDDPGALKRLMREQKFAKLPVYEGAIDRIIGLVYAKDLFLGPDRPLRALVHPVPFVPDMITLTQLLAHFRETRTQLAIVVNEYGALVGLVTVEDVAEQIVGEIEAPDEAAGPPVWEQLDERRYRVSGGAGIRDWVGHLELFPPHDRMTTLAGLVISHLGRMPAVGDEVRLGNLKMKVASLSGRRIEWILLELADGRNGRDDPTPEREPRP